MRYLLDTCTFLWLLTDAPSLSPRAREIGAHGGVPVSVSVVSTWEILVKHNLGKMPLPQGPSEFLKTALDEFGYDILPLSLQATLHVSKLPDHHCDPFDRMLICQAMTEGMTIVTPDVEIQRYPVLTVWK
jgi:PIN domain nuclease of toxin-antitoxin system